MEAVGSEGASGNGEEPPSPGRRKRRRVAGQAVAGRLPRPCREFVAGGERGLCPRCGWGLYPHGVSRVVDRKKDREGPEE
jgi:hypothetical protein